LEAYKPLFTFGIAHAGSPGEEKTHPTDGLITYNSPEGDIHSRIQIIPRKSPNAMFMRSRIEVRSDKPFILDVKRPVDAETFGITLAFSGSSFLEFEDGSVFLFEQGYCTLTASHPLGRAVWKINSGQPYDTMTFTFSREERLETLKDITLSPELAGLVSEGLDQRILWRTPISPLLHKIARETEENSFHGAARIFFLESKALEALSALTEMLDQSARSKEPALDKAEMPRLIAVRDTLLARVNDPPSLLELADQAGMNYKKLVRGFQAAFGFTPNAFLQDRRIELGRSMLEKGVSVKETAAILGYHNASNFIHAYHKKYGHTPGQARAGKTS